MLTRPPARFGWQTSTRCLIRTLSLSALDASSRLTARHSDRQPPWKHRGRLRTRCRSVVVQAASHWARMIAAVVAVGNTQVRGRYGLTAQAAGITTTKREDSTKMIKLKIKRRANNLYRY